MFILFVTGLTKQCQQRTEKNYDYKKLMKISDFPGIQPKGYLVRLPFYVLAPRDAHIVFSATESPNWTRDNVYEICKQNKKMKNLLLSQLMFYLYFFLYC